MRSRRLNARVGFGGFYKVNEIKVEWRARDSIYRYLKEETRYKGNRQPTPLNLQEWGWEGGALWADLGLYPSSELLF